MSRISEALGSYATKKFVAKNDVLVNVTDMIKKNTDRPPHYGSKSGQDVIDVAEDFGIIDNAYKFNMLKYLLRGGKKVDNSELQDMTKIRVYLDRYIEKLQSEIQEN